MSGRTVWLVLPAYNEEASLPPLLAGVERSFAELPMPYRVVVVDDGSADRTLAVAREWAERIPLEVVVHEVNQGLGATIRDGLTHAAAHAAPDDAIVSMDADNSHSPGLVPRMVERLGEGYEVVIASRYRQGSRTLGVPLMRRALSYWGGWLFRGLFPTRGVKDYTCGFRAYRASVLQQAIAEEGESFFDQDGFQCMVDILLKLRRRGAVFTEVPMVLRYDLKEGESKMRVGSTAVTTLALLARRRLAFRGGESAAAESERCFVGSRRETAVESGIRRGFPDEEPVKQLRSEAGGVAPRNARSAVSERYPAWHRWGLLAVLVAGLLLRLWIAGARPDNTRHFDERFSLRNVEALLAEGTVEPANAYYPNLSWLPQALAMGASEGLSRATGIEALSVYSESTPDGWSPTAYYLARGVSVLWGVLGIWAAFALGRWLFDGRVGLAAAVLVAALPPHIVSSGLFKPDILVSLMVSVTILWSLRAVDRPTVGRFLLAGCGVGLAVAAKYTGVGAAFPVIVAALWAGWRSPRRWLLLAAAGVASLAVFFLLNPHTAVVFQYLPRLWGIMESKGDAAGGSHLAVVAQEFGYLVRHHGWAITALAFAGIGGLVVRLLRRGGGAVQGAAGARREAAMMLSYILGYPALYAASTALFKGQNLLSLLPLTAIVASWAAFAGWDWLAGRWVVLSRRWIVLPVIAAVVAVLFVAPWQTVYRTAKPSTYQLAGRYLASNLEPPEVRRFYFEKRDEALAANRSGHRLPGLPVDRLSEVAAEDLERADGLAFFADRLDDDDPRFYLQRLTSSGARARRFEPTLPNAWGPGLVVVLNGWEVAGEPEPLAWLPAAAEDAQPGGGWGRPAGVRAERPPAAEELTSLTLRVPRNRRGPRPGRLRIAVDGGETIEVPLVLTRLAEGQGHYQTAKLALPAGFERLTLTLDDGVDLAAGAQGELWRWRRSG